MKIETTRLIVRNFVKEDASDLYEILGDEETMRYCEPPYSFEKTQDFLNDFCVGRAGAVAAVHKQSRKVIGYILFNEYTKNVYEVGWFFNRKFWKQGYAYEACNAVIDYAFTHLRAHKLFAETIDSVKSVALMKKLGMQPEGIQRSHTKDLTGQWADLYCYGLLEKDWLKNHKKCSDVTVSIRRAETADYDSVEAIMKEVQQLHVDWRPDIYKPAGTGYSRDYFERLVAEKRLMIAESDGAVAGLLSFMYRHIESDKQVTRDVIFVDDLAVKEEYRGRGIGTQLLNQMRGKVTVEHLDGLELQVNARNIAARKMYEKFGFTEKSINLELL